MESGDLSFSGEENFLAHFSENQYDVVIGDPKFKRLVGHAAERFVPFHHFAVSGQLEDGRQI